MSVLVKGWSIPTDGCCGCYFRTGKYCGILTKNERVLEYAERFTRPDNCPLVDEEPVKRGKWIIRDNPGTGWYRVTCSECGENVTATAPCIGFYPNVRVTWNYCPECGARMDEE